MAIHVGYILNRFFMSVLLPMLMKRCLAIKHINSRSSIYFSQCIRQIPHHIGFEPIERVRHFRKG
ncbi:hypothetical protein CVS51_21215, partial [Ralstonia solanacearum]